MLFSSVCFNIICFYFPAVNYGVAMDLFERIFFWDLFRFLRSVHSSFIKTGIFRAIVLKRFFFFRHSIFSHSFQVSDDMNVRPLAIVSVVPKALIIFSALFRLLFLLDHF